MRSRWRQIELGLIWWLVRLMTPELGIGRCSSDPVGNAAPIFPSSAGNRPTALGFGSGPPGFRGDSAMYEEMPTHPELNVAAEQAIAPHSSDERQRLSRALSQAICAGLEALAAESRVRFASDE
jgi:hypothetical protein